MPWFSIIPYKERKPTSAEYSEMLKVIRTAANFRLLRLHWQKMTRVLAAHPTNDYV